MVWFITDGGNANMNTGGVELFNNVFDFDLPCVENSPEPSDIQRLV